MGQRDQYMGLSLKKGIMNMTDHRTELYGQLIAIMEKLEKSVPGAQKQYFVTWTEKYLMTLHQYPWTISQKIMMHITRDCVEFIPYEIWDKLSPLIGDILIELDELPDKNERLADNVMPAYFKQCAAIEKMIEG